MFINDERHLESDYDDKDDKINPSNVHLLLETLKKAIDKLYTFKETIDSKQSHVHNTTISIPSPHFHRSFGDSSNLSIINKNINGKKSDVDMSMGDSDAGTMSLSTALKKDFSIPYDRLQKMVYDNKEFMFMERDRFLLIYSCIISMI